MVLAHELIHALRGIYSISDGNEESEEAYCNIDSYCGVDGYCKNDSTCGLDSYCSYDSTCGIDSYCKNDAYCGLDGYCSRDCSCGLDGYCSSDGSCGIDSYCKYDAGCGHFIPTPTALGEISVSANGGGMAGEPFTINASCPNADHMYITITCSETGYNNGFLVSGDSYSGVFTPPEAGTYNISLAARNTATSEDPGTEHKQTSIYKVVTNGNLQLGNTGAEVTALQQYLVSLGYSCIANGTFDSATDAAVRKFQGLVGLSADGIVGTATLGALSTAISCKNSGNMCRGMISEGIRQLQINLNTLGHNCGTPDGEFGSDTFSAVCNFQSSTGTLSPTGIADAETINSINLAIGAIHEPINISINDYTADQKIITASASDAKSIKIEVTRPNGIVEVSDPDGDEVQVGKFCDLEEGGIYQIKVTVTYPDGSQKVEYRSFEYQSIGNIEVGEVTTSSITWELTNVRNKEFKVYDDENTLVYSSIPNENVCNITTSNLNPGKTYRAVIMNNGNYEDYQYVTTQGTGNSIIHQSIIDAGEAMRRQENWRIKNVEDWTTLLIAKWKLQGDEVLYYFICVDTIWLFLYNL